MPSFIKDRGGKLKQLAATDNPDQASEQAKQLAAEAASATPAAEPEKK